MKKILSFILSALCIASVFTFSVFASDNSLTVGSNTVSVNGAYTFTAPDNGIYEINFYYDGFEDCEFSTCYEGDKDSYASEDYDGSVFYFANGESLTYDVETNVDLNADITFLGDVTEVTVKDDKAIQIHRDVDIITDSYDEGSRYFIFDNCIQLTTNVTSFSLYILQIPTLETSISSGEQTINCDCFGSGVSLTFTAFSASDYIYSASLPEGYEFNPILDNDGYLDYEKNVIPNLVLDTVDGEKIVSYDDEVGYVVNFNDGTVVTLASYYDYDDNNGNIHFIVCDGYYGEDNYLIDVVGKGTVDSEEEADDFTKFVNDVLGGPQYFVMLFTNIIRTILNGLFAITN